MTDNTSAAILGRPKGRSCVPIRHGKGRWALPPAEGAAAGAAKGAAIGRAEDAGRKGTADRR